MLGYLKIIRSGSITEIYTYAKAPSSGRKKGTVIDRTRRGSPRPRVGANAERARKSFIRLVRSNIGTGEPPALITLTMLDIVRIEVGYSCLSNYIRLLRRRFGKEFKYVAVPEYQKRGAVHFHILFWGLPQEVINHERRDRTLQRAWALGYVDCVATDGSEKLAGYLAKYMSKSMSDERIAGKKAYACSRNIMRPVLATTLTGFENLGSEFWAVDNVLLTEKEFQTEWLGKATYKMLYNKSYGK